MRVTFETTGKIAVLTINRPLAMNSLDAETLASLNKAWIDFRDNPELWVAIITGAGDKAFCAGIGHQDLGQVLQQHDCGSNGGQKPTQNRGWEGSRATLRYGSPL